MPPPETVARRPRTVDIHTHVLPRTLPRWAERFGEHGYIELEPRADGCLRMLRDGRAFRDVGANCWDPNVRIRECDAHAVDVQVLSTIPVMFNYDKKPQHTLEVARYLNDHVAELVRAHPQRFQGLGTLPMQAPELAIVELRRCVQELGLRGVQIGSHVNAWNLSAPELFPLFAEAAALGAAVFVHPWDMMGEERMQKYWLPWLVGMPAESSLAICSLIFGGVFERLPSLRVAIAHGGGAFPGTLGRIEHGHQCRPDLVAIDNAKGPREYLGHFWVDSLVHDPKMLALIVEMFGAHRVALGSDYPFPLGEDVPGTLIASSGLSASVQEQLLWRSAHEWLGLPADAPAIV